MSQLKLAVTIAEAIIGIIVVLELGDYLGYKFSRRRLAIVLAILALAVIVLFAIYAAIYTALT